MNLIRYWRRIDSTLLMAVLGLGVICLLIIASATHANMDGQPGQYDFVMKQGIFFVGGLIIAGGSLYFDYRKLYRFVPILYGINAILLLVVKFAGTSALGAQRWIQLGPFTLQPSEFAKTIMIICLARLMAHDRSGFQTWKRRISSRRPHFRWLWLTSWCRRSGNGSRMCFFTNPFVMRPCSDSRRRVSWRGK